MIQLSVVLLQYEASGKYPHALRRLLAVLDRLRTVDLRLIVVDNAREGGWEHRISETVLQIGGDNRAWEFSAFDKALAVFERWRPGTEVFALVTDAFGAYGDDYLGLIDDNVVRCVFEIGAAVGWMDSYGLEQCRIGPLTFDTYMRSSFVFLPGAAIDLVSPLAADLDAMDVFGTGAEQPFAGGSALSENLKEILLEWLTTEAVPEHRLPERWHSRFELTAESYPFFRAKAGAILREHLLSARLKAGGVACYDYRCLRYLANQGRLEAFLAQGGDAACQWLGWRSLLKEEPPSETGDATPAAAPVPAGPAAGAPVTLLLAGELGDSAADVAARFFVERVLPLIRQRHSAIRLLAVGEAASSDLADAEGGALQILRSADHLRDSGLMDTCVAAVAPPGSDPACLGWVDDLPGPGLPLVAGGDALRRDQTGTRRSHLRAESPVEFAAACCSLIEQRPTGRRSS